MSEDKKSLIDLVPDSVDNAVKNITDKPTQNMGTTFADIWYLVFGGISQAAEKRKLKYSYALQEFEKELKEKISKIPKDKFVDPDIQIVAKALEEAKYCIDKEELRNMFSSLISSSMNKDIFVSPIIINIISSLSSLDAKILNYFFQHQSTKINMHDLLNYLGINIFSEEVIGQNKIGEYHNVYFSLMELHHLNLIYSPEEILPDTSYGYLNLDGNYTSIESTKLSMLGFKFCEICLQ